MKLYPQSEKEFSDSVFQDPPAEYRGTPFWSWNTKLEKGRLKEQIGVFEEMGMGGFHIHSRIGLDTEYLGTEFLEDIRFCIDYAKEKGMRCWLYDEDKWPSGYGGGRVTVNSGYKNKFLLFSPERKPDGYMRQREPKELNRLAVAGEGRLIARYNVILKNGRLFEYQRLSDIDGDTGNTWYAYLVIAEESPWFNNQSYVDTLNKKAIQEFVNQVHKRYYDAFGDEFSKMIPAIFTDEPQFSRKDCFSFAEGKEELKIPFTDDLEQGFQETYGRSLLDGLPELFWELPAGVSKIRYLYHDYVAERFAEAYGDTIGDWSREHNILLTGHMMEEPELGSQTRTLGEAMRQYRSFGLPGVDMLADYREYTTVKQAQSASHQYGCPGVLSELYGVTNWDFDFRGHKLQGDWQAALGVTQRVHHLSWLSMKGESKRDYPAPIDEHSPWYKKYHYIEEYFARINTVLTRGNAVVPIGVIHPIESYWLFYGPNDDTGEIRSSLEEDFARLAEWLLFGLFDFDYICESQLPELYHEENDQKFHVGKMTYSVIIVPQMKTIRRSTVNRLKKFAEVGGIVYWLNTIPAYMDAEAVSKETFDFGKILPFERHSLYCSLETWKEFSVKTEDGERSESFLSQVRVDGENKWIFLAHGRKELKTSDPEDHRLTMTIKGQYQVEKYNAMDGTHRKLETEYSNGNTRLRILYFEDDSILLKLIPFGAVSDSHKVCREETEKEMELSLLTQQGYLAGPAEYLLSEPNCLLLDQASYRIDGETEYGCDKKEVLKIEDELRCKYGYPLRSESFPQPWLEGDKKDVEQHSLILTYTFRSDRIFKGTKLAAEADEDWKIFFNGQKCIKNSDFWLDRTFSVYQLPEVREGENVLTVSLPFGRKTALEWCYLLGEFGVVTDGINNSLTEKPRQLEFGDITRQKLPFYGGNITYRKKIAVDEKKHLYLQIPNYSGTLISVQVAGNSTEQIICCSPYIADLGIREPGLYCIDITLYGNRFNMFGQLHNCNKNERYYGPYTWRTDGAVWSREYQCKPTGILSSPLIYAELLI
ncbi:MAG: glycosyl hydrolase [Hungatella hathewayi]|uniref:glycosyl hydrolase n=1 Tax=Hungatella TaxID=1649459 RepID=UPI001105D2F1|nr:MULTISPECIES: glycosyl hydrolase [Hungatella]MCI7381084.1 hypothetical protein [Hungatella sp.]MDY6237340.1 glycosyl hydrolase [Hungatella hathewayi]